MINLLWSNVLMAMLGINSPKQSKLDEFDESHAQALVLGLDTCRFIAGIHLKCVNKQLFDGDVTFMMEVSSWNSICPVGCGNRRIVSGILSSNPFYFSKNNYVFFFLVSHINSTHFE